MYVMTEEMRILDFNLFAELAVSYSNRETLTLRHFLNIVVRANCRRNWDDSSRRNHVTMRPASDGASFFVKG